MGLSTEIVDKWNDKGKVLTTGIPLQRQGQLDIKEIHQEIHKPRRCDETSFRNYTRRLIEKEFVRVRKNSREFERIRKDTRS